MGNRKRVSSPGSKRTPEDRAKWAKERQALVGTLITQAGTFEGAMVLEHIRGSQYTVQLSSGDEVYASHKKSKDGSRNKIFSHQGWNIWESR